MRPSSLSHKPKRALLLLNPHREEKLHLMTSDHLGTRVAAPLQPGEALLGTPGYTFGLGFAVRQGPEPNTRLLPQDVQSPRLSGARRLKPSPRLHRISEW